METLQELWAYAIQPGARENPGLRAAGIAAPTVPEILHVITR